MPSNNLWADVI